MTRAKLFSDWRRRASTVAQVRSGVMIDPPSVTDRTRLTCPVQIFGNSRLLYTVGSKGITGVIKGFTADLPGGETILKVHTEARSAFYPINLSRLPCSDGLAEALIVGNHIVAILTLPAIQEPVILDCVRRTMRHEFELVLRDGPPIAMIHRTKRVFFKGDEVCHTYRIVFTPSNNLASALCRCSSRAVQSDGSAWSVSQLGRRHLHRLGPDEAFQTGCEGCCCCCVSRTVSRLHLLTTASAASG